MRGLGNVYKRGPIYWIRYSCRGREFRESSRSTERPDAVRRRGISLRRDRRRLDQHGRGDYGCEWISVEGEKPMSRYRVSGGVLVILGLAMAAYGGIGSLFVAGAIDQPGEHVGAMDVAILVLFALFGVGLFALGVIGVLRGGPKR